MSLLNIHISNDLALVAVDTRVRGNAPSLSSPIYGEASKLLALPHANLMLAARGDVTWISMIFAELNGSLVTGFDDACEVAPEIARRNISVYRAMREAQGLKEGIGDIECAIVGYSERHGRMAGIHWSTGNAHAGAYDIHHIDPWVLSPSANDDEVPEEPNTAEHMAAYARRQVARLDRETPWPRLWREAAARRADAGRDQHPRHRRLGNGRLMTPCRHMPASA